VQNSVALCFFSYLVHFDVETFSQCVAPVFRYFNSSTGNCAWGN